MSFRCGSESLEPRLQPSVGVGEDLVRALEARVGLRVGLELRSARGEAPRHAEVIEDPHPDPADDGRAHGRRLVDELAASDWQAPDVAQHAQEGLRRGRAPDRVDALDRRARLAERPQPRLEVEADPLDDGAYELVGPVM